MDSASKKHLVLSNEMIDEKRLAMRKFLKVMDIDKPICSVKQKRRR